MSATIETYTATKSAQYRNNYEKIDGDHMPCYLCGKAVKVEKYFARISDGGATIATDEYADRDPLSDCGLYPIGPECYKRLPAEAKALIKKVEV